MKSVRKTVWVLFVVVLLSASALVLGQLDPSLSPIAIARSNSQHVLQHQIAQLGEAFQPNVLTFGIGAIWSRVKCQLESLAASRRSTCDWTNYATR